ncbi:hypothetical protein ABKV19_005158, partial [Rosa sericea]
CVGCFGLLSFGPKELPNQCQEVRSHRWMPLPTHLFSLMAIPGCQPITQWLP